MAALQTIPKKGYEDYPKALQDGGGFRSFPDWSERQVKQSHPDIFADPRKRWMTHIINHRWDKRLLAHIAAQHIQPLFSDEEVDIFRKDINRFLESADRSPDWSIPPDQPLCLYILQQLSSILRDPDDQLLFDLINGVPTCFHRDIPLSNCFTPVADDDADAPPLPIHLDNWKSVHEDPDVTSRLVQEEIDNQWVDLFEGDETDAQSQFPAGISVGKLGVAYSDSCPPRLVVDLSERRVRYHQPKISYPAIPFAIHLTIIGAQHWHEMGT